MSEAAEALLMRLMSLRKNYKPKSSTASAPLLPSE